MWCVQLMRITEKGAESELVIRITPNQTCLLNCYVTFRKNIFRKANNTIRRNMIVYTCNLTIASVPCAEFAQREDTSLIHEEKKKEIISS